MPEFGCLLPDDKMADMMSKHEAIRRDNADEIGHVAYAGPTDWKIFLERPAKNVWVAWKNGTWESKQALAPSETRRVVDVIQEHRYQMGYL